MNESDAHPLFRTMRVDRERMDDGRTILYYSWPDQPDAPPVESAGPASAPVGAPRAEPWSSEAGPPQPTEPVAGRDV